MWRSSAWNNIAWKGICVGVALSSLWIPARSSYAVSCAVVRHPAPAEEEKAFLAGDFAKAVELYQAALAKNPTGVDLAIGLVHALLRQQKVQAADSAVHAFIGNKPATAALLTLRAEVEL